MGITAQTANFIPTMLETVRPKLSYFLAMKQSKFAGLFNKAAEKHQVSAFTDAAASGSPTYSLGGPVLAWRVPLLLFMGGDYQAFSLDGGDLCREARSGAAGHAGGLPPNRFDRTA